MSEKKVTLTESEFKVALTNYFKGLAHSEQEEFYCKPEVCSYYDTSVRFDLGIAIYPKEENRRAWTHSNLKLIGIEIKTDKDTFNRLSTQLPNYVKVFDEVYIAVQSKEIPKQIPQFIGVVRINEKKEIVIERKSQISATKFDDYCNRFIFNRGLAELDFKIKDTDAGRLQTLLNSIYEIRRKFMANTFFGSRVYNSSDAKAMKFTIPLTPREKEMLKSIFSSRQIYLNETKEVSK